MCIVQVLLLSRIVHALKIKTFLFVLLKHHCLLKVEKVVMFMQVICCVDCLKQILIYLCTLNNNLLYFRASVAFLFSLSYSIPEINRLCGPVF